jgi:DNA-directed RNA polymerase subunit L
VSFADEALEDTKTTAFDALRKGLEDLMAACDVVTEKFTDARDEFVP